jgi:hypothetical protein
MGYMATSYFDNLRDISSKDPKVQGKIDEAEAHWLACEGCRMGDVSKHVPDKVDKPVGFVARLRDYLTGS